MEINCCQKGKDQHDSGSADNRPDYEMGTLTFNAVGRLETESGLMTKEQYARSGVAISNSKGNYMLHKQTKHLKVRDDPFYLNKQQQQPKINIQDPGRSFSRGWMKFNLDSDAVECASERAVPSIEHHFDASTIVEPTTSYFRKERSSASALASTAVSEIVSKTTPSCGRNLFHKVRSGTRTNRAGTTAGFGLTMTQTTRKVYKLFDTKIRTVGHRIRTLNIKGAVASQNGSKAEVNNKTSTPVLRSASRLTEKKQVISSIMDEEKTLASSRSLTMKEKRVPTYLLEPFTEPPIKATDPFPGHPPNLSYSATRGGQFCTPSMPTIIEKLI